MDTGGDGIVSSREWLKQGAADYEGELCAISAKAKRLFNFMDANQDGEVSLEEWTKAFDRIDSDGNGFVSKKEWCQRHGTAALYEIVFKMNSVRVTRDEWRQAFQAMDTDGDGIVSTREWLQKKRRSFASEQWGALMQSPKDLMLKHPGKKGSVRRLVGRWE